MSRATRRPLRLSTRRRTSGVAVLVACALGGAACARSTPPATARDASSAVAATFTVSSPAFTAGGRLPTEFTCDGASVNPPLAWRGAPAGTVGYAVVMHHLANPTDVHWYWVVHGLGAEVDHLDANTVPPGQLGTNSVNDRLGYAPPCSQGPGDKTYTFTVYALDRRPAFAERARVSRQVLLDAIAGHVLAEGSIDVVYARPASAASGGAGSPGGAGAPPAKQPPPGGGSR